MWDTLYFMGKQADAQDKVDETSANWQESFRGFEDNLHIKIE
jgi:hypothetical protein